MQVMFEGILLKPSMVTPGADATKREKPEVVADYTLKLLRRRVPPAVPGECCNILINLTCSLAPAPAMFMLPMIVYSLIMIRKHVRSCGRDFLLYLM